MISITDLFKLIPDHLKQSAIDALVETVVSRGEGLISQTILSKIEGLRSDASFRQQIDVGLQKGLQRFINEYQLQDEDLVAAIASDVSIFSQPEVKQALLIIVQKPSQYLTEEQDLVGQSFTTILPQRINRQRVDRAITYLLRCLAQELWHMPEFQPIYSLEFQRITAESTHEQLAVQKAQLAALNNLNADMRDALLQLTNALTEQKLLPVGQSPSAQSIRSQSVFHNLSQPDHGEFVGREKEIQQIFKLLQPYPRSRHHLIVIDGIGGIGKSTLAMEIAHRCLYTSLQAIQKEHSEQDSLVKFRQILIERFNEDELRTLCFDMALDYDMLPGRDKGGKSRELVSFLQRRNRMNELEEYLKNIRPNIPEFVSLNDDSTQELTAEIFDAIVWTSAKQTILSAEGIEPRYHVLHTLDDIYTAIANTLQREDINHATSEEQANLIRNTLTQQRTLLIVDNLETVDDEAVFDFLRELPAPTKAIVTTRHRIDIAYPIRLLGMDENDALKLIIQEAARHQIQLRSEQTARLIKHTGGVPLAIVWSLAQMGFGHEIETVLYRLGQPNNDIIRFCFEASLAQIQNSPAYQLLKALSLFIPDGSRKALGIVASLSDLDRDDGLVILEKLSLVNKKNNRFTLLPITKTLATYELHRESAEEIVFGQRWKDYLIGLYRSQEEPWFAYRLHYRSNLFPSDGRNFLAAIEWAHEYGTAEDIFWLSIGAISFLDSQGRWNALIELTHRILDLARSTGNKVVLGQLMDTLGWIYEQRGEFSRSEMAYHEGLLAYQEIGDKEGEVILLQRLSGVNRKQGNYEKAQNYIDSARFIATELEVGDMLALINTQEGKLARDLQEWDRSWELFSKVLVWFEKRTETTPRQEDLAIGTWGHLAIIAYHQGRPEEAKQLCLRSLDYFEQFGTKGYLATLNYRLALAEEALGNDKEAISYINNAIEWYERLGMKPDLPDAFILRERLLQNCDSVEVT